MNLLVKLLILAKKSLVSKLVTRVSGEGHIACGFCRNCRAGRRICAAITLASASHAMAVLLNISSFQLSMLTLFQTLFQMNKPQFSILLVMRTHTALSFDLVGEDVLITGAGPVGIMAAAIARHVGARYVVITDVNEYRLRISKKNGGFTSCQSAKHILKKSWIQLEMTEGFDVGLEMSGNPQHLTT